VGFMSPPGGGRPADQDQSAAGRPDIPRSLHRAGARPCGPARTRESQSNTRPLESRRASVPRAPMGALDGARSPRRRRYNGRAPLMHPVVGRPTRAQRPGRPTRAADLTMPSKADAAFLLSLLAGGVAASCRPERAGDAEGAGRHRIRHRGLPHGGEGPPRLGLAGQRPGGFGSRGQVVAGTGEGIEPVPWPFFVPLRTTLTTRRT
jgi:hypothetical protein